MTKPGRERRDTADDHVLQVEIPAQPRKEPRQARSIALVTALKQTGRWILEREGREALTALRLAEEAGVAISSIYEYFPAMEALIAAIFEDYRLEVRAELHAGIRALPPSATLFDGILLTLSIGLAVHYKKTLFDPAFSVRSTHYDELVRLDLVKAKQLWSTSATSTLMERFASEIRVRDREKAEFLVLHTLLTLPRAMLLEKPEYLVADDTPLMIARMVHALLTTPDE
ncbi:TetR/AcrR family transcriptional regulator [Pseudomonas sp. GD03860]|uniref:TetR/AcrR family transcriptional regulator n=1 Tax=Pseudomonas TaxID=286 RepID=UPI0023648D62|nr:MULTISPECIES: TetR family transcriptional regulator [Pseudomonas]MDD2058534.1 TetR/AcrR family transcriptional regulator [Pseudomonas putida]MDH0640716.1 TetR/AcrR family transcriptional regulator [Pseudomonas sp. GD03860]